TGLANRRRFDSELQRHLERVRRYGNTGAVLLLDLDNFKQVNDSLGHNAGDQLLVTIGGLLRRAVRETDVVARLGGDEFAVLMTDGDQAAAMLVGEGIVNVVRDHAATLDGVRRRVTASVGAVTFKAASEQSSDILALADMTMYDAKEAGRNQVALLPEGETRPPKFSARLQWQSRIEDALEFDRFELHLQPIMNLSNDRITSAEVLLRLRDNDELVPPSRFIYIAERVGLMPRIDAWVVENSLAMLARLRELDPTFELEVNLSGHSIGHPHIEQTIRDSLVMHGVEPSALILEITETAAVADVALARAFAERITDLGCAFALDDFGAGFGSFYYLKHLFFDYVKIDGEFVAHVHESQVDRTIMRSIVGIARDLGKRTVAEFVSEPEILAVCREEGVDFVQGFLIGKPVPYDEFVASFLPAGAVAAANE
ncbi:MAG: EAL domain-containing protein, partial [Nocardioides sp.]|uniref:putative bifunctional diguanylate cyclase/phosphodiesterase n=1 Tax=Nocardioides sp. TaxID=35761 RepID=UPI0032659A07